MSKAIIPAFNKSKKCMSFRKREKELKAFPAPPGSLPVPLKAQKGPCGWTLPSSGLSQQQDRGVSGYIQCQDSMQLQFFLSHLPLSLPE